MRPSRFSLAIVAAAMLTLLAAMPAAAARPTRPLPPPTSGEQPLTPDEVAAAERKASAAEAYVASITSAGGDLVSLSCVTPQSGGSVTPTATCEVPRDFLPVEARDQINGYYCGPAVGQVIANYAWAVAAGANKYTQKQIAAWMQTDAFFSTDAGRLEDGLETATWAAPRRPANWDWVILEVKDRDGDRTTGDELHAYVRSNITNSRMPLAISVKPHDPASNYNLNSWPNPVQSVGHWITAYGWYGTWTGTDFARIYYTDSSKDEGGSTGKFWNSTKSMAALIAEHTRRIVW